LSLYEGKSLVGWSEEYVNSLKVLRGYIEALEQKTPVSPQEFSKFNLLIECQRILSETSKSCIKAMLTENMFNVSELSESFVLLEPYLFETNAGYNKKRA
jgi:hypothetical protein